MTGERRPDTSPVRDALGDLDHDDGLLDHCAEDDPASAATASEAAEYLALASYVEAVAPNECHPAFFERRAQVARLLRCLAQEPDRADHRRVLSGVRFLCYRLRSGTVGRRESFPPATEGSRLPPRRSHNRGGGGSGSADSTKR